MMMADLRLDRTRLFAGAGIVAALNALAPRIAWSLDKGGWRLSIFELFGISGILWMALAVMAMIALEECGEAPRRSDWLAAALVTIAALVPAPLLVAALIVPYAAFGLMTARGDHRMRRIAAIMLAMTLTLCFGPLCLRLFPELLAADAHLVAGALGMHADGNLFRSVDGSRQFLIAPGCSSLNNISLATIFMVSLVQWLRLPQRVPLIGWTIVASLATVAVNILRLAVLAWRPGELQYWHHGWGSVMFGWLNLLALGSIVVFAVARLQGQEEKALAPA